MKRIIYIFAMILLTACQKKELEPVQEVKPLAPLEINNDYDSFYLNNKKYSLPLSYEELKENGISLNEDEFYYQKINKNSQTMANLKGNGLDLGATFKNKSSEQIDIKEATIIELYINNTEGENKDFSINGLSRGSSYQEAKSLLKNIQTEEASKEDDKTINYYTDQNYVSLYFENEKLSSVAIFSKSFMRDEAYINGEFVVFGQTLKFPLTIHDLEDLLSSNINIEGNYKNLDPGDEITIRIYSPLFDDMEDKPSSSGVDFELKNTSPRPISIKDAQIVGLVAESSSDLSVGNIYVGASLDELKMVDKKNQNPPRLSIEGKTNEQLSKFIFTADNDTSYIYYADDEVIRHIEIRNTKEQ